MNPAPSPRPNSCHSRPANGYLFLVRLPHSACSCSGTVDVSAEHFQDRHERWGVIRANYRSSGPGPRHKTLRRATTNGGIRIRLADLANTQWLHQACCLTGQLVRILRRPGVVFRFLTDCERIVSEQACVVDRFTSYLCTQHAVE